jgi:hypothetical protein
LYVKNIFAFYAMAGGKHAPERKSAPSQKHIAIDLDTKIRMIHKYEGEQSLSAIASEPDFVVSVMRVSSCMIEHGKFIFHFIYMIYAC